MEHSPQPNHMPAITAVHSGAPAQKLWRSLFILSGLVPLLSIVQRKPDSLLIYSVFVAVCLLRRKLAALADRLPGPKALHLIGLFIVAGELAEAFAWMGNYTKQSPHPGLLHPQLFANAILAVGLYIGWGLAWLITLRWYRFTLAEAFLLTAFQGVFLEGWGKVFMGMIAVLPTNPLLALMMGVYVAAVHGSVVGIVMAPVVHRFDDPFRSRHWTRFPVVIALVVVLVIVGCDVASRLTVPFGGLPPKRSIVEHPFW